MCLAIKMGQTTRLTDVHLVTMWYCLQVELFHGAARKQRVTALSTIETEYFLVCHSAKDVLWFRNFLEEFLNKQFLNFLQNIHVVKVLLFYPKPFHL